MIEKINHHLLFFLIFFPISSFLIKIEVKNSTFHSIIKTSELKVIDIYFRLINCYFFKQFKESKFEVFKILTTASLPLSI